MTAKAVLRVAVLGTLATALLILPAAEVAVRTLGAGGRAAVYGGALAGWLVGLVGLAFVWLIARVPPSATGKFWKLWACGLLLRGLLLLGSAAVLAVVCAEQLAATVFALVAVYLAGLFAEAGWLAGHLARQDPRQR